MIRSKRVAAGSRATCFGRIIRPNVGPAVAWLSPGHPPNWMALVSVPLALAAIHAATKTP